MTRATTAVAPKVAKVTLELNEYDVREDDSTSTPVMFAGAPATSMVAPGAARAVPVTLKLAPELAPNKE